MAGWGLTNRNVKPKILKKADLKVLSYADCQFLLSQTTQQNVSLTIQHMCVKSEPWTLGGCVSLLMFFSLTFISNKSFRKNACFTG